MPSSALPEGTSWYVVVKCDSELIYKNIALLTTDLDEARKMEREIDGCFDRTALVEAIVVYDS